MAEVSIQKVETRYRLPRSLRAEQRRLDQLTRRVVGMACAEALEQLGLPEDSELCLRNVFVPVWLRLNSTDRSLMDHWSSALALEIVTTIRNGSTRRAVVYQSRRQALIDLAQSVARGDLRRCWAWRQLGLWKAPPRTTDPQATVELVCALRGAPELVVPTLSALAWSGDLQNLARLLTEQHWQALAAAATGEEMASRLLSKTSASPTGPVVSEARHVIGRSILLRSFAGSVWFIQAREPVRRAIAVLAIVEVLPMLLQRESAPMLIGVIADATGKRDQALRNGTEEISLLAESESADSEYVDIESEDSSPLRNDVAATSETSTRETDQREDPKPLDLRQRAFTRWAGLLFLLGVLEDLKLPETILEHPVLGRRDFSWALHQLALTLIATNADDPAVLAFVGLPPNAKPPSITEEPATPDETAALLPFVELITECLRVLVGLEPEVSLIEFVCHRRAQLVVDPGWIEVRLSLDDISTDIRRAGLDLNPGHISWLGIVVNFVYE